MCKNIVPVQIHTLTSYRKDDGPLMVHGIEVSMVKLVAQLRQMDTGNLPQSLSFTLDDDTGRVEAIQYLTEEEDVSLPANNTMIQVIGSLKIGPDQNMLKVLDLLDRFDVDGVRSCIESSKYSHGISRQELYNKDQRHYMLVEEHCQVKKNDFEY